MPAPCWRAAPPATKGYRYLVERGEETSTAVFLNAVKEVALQKVLLTGCIAVSLLCMLLAFTIIVVLQPPRGRPVHAQY